MPVDDADVRSVERSRGDGAGFCPSSLRNTAVNNAGRRHLRTSAIRAYRRGADARIIRREQRIDRHLHEFRVAVIGFAIGRNELDGLDQPMQIDARVVRVPG